MHSVHPEGAPVTERLDDPRIERLRTVVQTNCDIADARHAGDYTLCVYLLKMRELFRWEHGYSYTAELPKEALSQWLTSREALWDELVQQGYRELPMAGGTVAPFDTEAANALLRDEGLVYSGGLGQRGRPHFFLARLLDYRDHGRYQVLVAGEEYARDLAAPPAMTLGSTVFVRRESLRRMLWEKLEEWRWNRPDTPLGRAFQAYGFDGDAEHALDRMTETELEPTLLHELGEVSAGERVGGTWNDMLSAVAGTPAEIFARAVRDHLADCLSTLPGLIEEQRGPSLHFFLGNMGGMRKALFPALRAAYDRWHDSGDGTPLTAIADQGVDHWQGVAEEMLALYRTHGAACVSHLEALIEARRL